MSLEITTIASLTRETSAIIPKKLLKKELTYTSNTFQGSFMQIFAAAKTSLVIIRTQLRFHFELFLMCPYHPQRQPNLLLVSLGMSGPL